MTWGKIRLISVFIILFSAIIVLCGCRDIVFNNPLDPNASKDVIKVIQVVSTSLNGDGDLGFDGEKLWNISLSGLLTAVDRESGIEIRSYAVEPGSGVAFLNDVIYICSNGKENILVIVDPLSGDILNRLSTRDLYPAFLTPSGNGRLLLFDARSSGIFDYDPQSGDSTRLFQVSGFTIGGMTRYKNDLLISDKNTDSIFRFTLSGSVVTVYSSPASGIGGMTVDTSSYLYILMRDGKINKVSLP